MPSIPSVNVDVHVGKASVDVSVRKEDSVDVFLSKNSVSSKLISYE